MKFVSVFQVVQQNRKSKARYVDGVKVGDVNKVEMTLRDTTGASNGNYALYFKLFRKVDGEFETTPFANVSQNELPKGYSTDMTNSHTVFNIQQID